MPALEIHFQYIGLYKGLKLILLDKKDYIDIFNICKDC